MPHLSPLNGLPIITDATELELCGSDLRVDGVIPGKGWKPRDYGTHPYGQLGFAGPYPGKLIPRSEFRDRIAEIDKTKSSLYHLCQAKGIKPYHQGSTNYCWINAPAKAVEVARVAAGQKHVPLSPASGGAIIKGFRNEGGWGTQAVQWIREYGLSTAKTWPPNAIDRRYNTPQADAERAKYKITEWFDMPRRSFEALATQLLLRNPVPIGLNWWGHEVLALSLVTIPSGFGVVILNSWGESWGQGGFSVLDEQHATADDQVACCSVTG